MKTKKMIPFLISAMIAVTPVMSVSAGTLTNSEPDGSTEVTAKIVDPGSVSYVITIPETADFGTLIQPENTDTDHYAYKDFRVEATKLNINSNQAVSVYIKDSASTDNQFYLTQKDVASDPFKISYDVYDDVVSDTNITDLTAINDDPAPGYYGYHLTTFASGTEGATQDVTLALNQNALYDQDLSAIAGDYSGTILFHSALITRTT